MFKDENLCGVSGIKNSDLIQRLFDMMEAFAERMSLLENTILKKCQKNDKVVQNEDITYQNWYKRLACAVTEVSTINGVLFLLLALLFSQQGLSYGSEICCGVLIHKTNYWG